MHLLRLLQTPKGFVEDEKRNYNQGTRIHQCGEHSRSLVAERLAGIGGTRLKCRITIELQTEPGGVPLFANLTDISLGGCFIETSTILSPGTKINVGFSMDDATLATEGVVMRLDPGSGVAVQFPEMNREGRERMFRIIEFVQKTTTFYNKRYLDSLAKS